jgi:5-oxoprolinase (ATP-hydrolysing)
MLTLLFPNRGGTFTDVWAAVDSQSDIVLKLLSVDPDNYSDAPSEGTYCKTGADEAI